MISYDEAKRLSNIEKHGIDFVGAETVFTNFHITQEDCRETYSETRFVTIGVLNGIVVVAHTPRNDCDHIISIRKAEKHEQKYYWAHYPH